MPFRRTQMTWQKHPYLKDDFQLQYDEIGFEVGRAGQNAPEQFVRLVPALTFMALKEATLYGVPPEKVYQFAHAPDRVRGRRYQLFNMKRLSPKSRVDEGQHLLYGGRLSDIMQSKTASPRLFSEKFAGLANRSKRALSDAEIMKFLVAFDSTVETSLDYTPAINLGADAYEAIKIIDRSVGLEESLRNLFDFYEFPLDTLEFLKKFTFLSYSQDITKDMYMHPEVITQKWGKTFDTLGVYNLDANHALLFSSRSFGRPIKQKPMQW